MNTACEYCAETIEPEALQCPHCGEHQGERDTSASSSKKPLLVGLALLLGGVGCLLPLSGALLFGSVRVAPAPAPVQIGQTTSVRALPTIPNPEIPARAVEFEGHSFLFVRAPSISWEDATRRAEASGAALAVVDSEAEQAFLSRLVADAGLSAAWIGRDAGELLQASVESPSLSADGYLCEWPGPK